MSPAGRFPQDARIGQQTPLWALTAALNEAEGSPADTRRSEQGTGPAAGHTGFLNRGLRAEHVTAGRGRLGEPDNPTLGRLHCHVPAVLDDPCCFSGTGGCVRVAQDGHHDTRGPCVNPGTYFPLLLAAHRDILSSAERGMLRAHGGQPAGAFSGGSWRGGGGT